MLKESSKVIDEVARLNAEAEEWLKSMKQREPDARLVVAIEADRLDKILVRLGMEFPSTDPKLFEQLKSDLGIK